MARKRNQSLSEDLVEIIAHFPWWVGIVLAIVSYFWLHHIAEAPVVPMTIQPDKFGYALSHNLFKGFASIGQYVLPFVCILGALGSALGRMKLQQLFSNVSASSSVSALNVMSWQEFEMLVGQVFRHTGYTVSENGGGGADGGVDLVLRKDGEKLLVQCKQWKAYKVGVSTVRELYGVMAAEGAAGGFVVTSGVFTQEAKDFAEGKNIELIDGAELKELIATVQPSSAVPKSSRPTISETSCPKCGGAMTKRIAKQGANTGKAFWGCNNFPQCRGIVAID